MKKPPALRLISLLILLGLAVLALQHRSTVQAALYGIGDGTRRLIGRPAPELPGGLRALDGTPAALGPLRGKVVLLHFWTLACGNCQRMLPRYDRLAADFGGRGLAVVGVHTPETDPEAERAALVAFVHAHDIRWQVVPDTYHYTWDRFAVEAWPTALLIDRAGVVRHVYVGDNHDEDLRRDADRLLH